MNVDIATLACMIGVVPCNILTLGVTELFFIQVAPSGTQRLFTITSTSAVVKSSPSASHKTATPTPICGGSAIVFASNHTGNYELYHIRLDNDEIEQITSRFESNASPYYSPDGRWILFDSNRDENFEIYFLDLSTLGSTRLTTNPDFDGGPDWRER